MQTYRATRILWGEGGTWSQTYRGAHLALCEVGSLVKVIITVVTAVTISMAGEIRDVGKVAIMTDDVIPSNTASVVPVILEAVVFSSELGVILPP